MLEELTGLDGRAAVLGAAGDSPYTRLMTGDRAGVVGWAGGGTVAWLGHGPWGPLVGTLGPRSGPLVAALHSAGLLGTTTWVHVSPDSPIAPVPCRLVDVWEFRWLDRDLPPPLPGEAAVERLSDADHPAIERLLLAGNASSSSRPGQPTIRAWYGVRAAGRLVACGADRSQAGVGFLAGITVEPGLRGTGLGAAVTAAMTRELLAELGTVTLGVAVENGRAIRLYDRLGFGASLGRTSYEITPPRRRASTGSRTGPVPPR